MAKVHLILDFSDKSVEELKQAVFDYWEAVKDNVHVKVEDVSPDDVVSLWYEGDVLDAFVESSFEETPRSCGHPVYSDGRCAEMACGNYYGKMQV